MRKLLIAECDEALRDALTEQLRRGWDITVCADGKVCIALVEQLRPDAVILGLSLPNADGLYILEQTAAFLPRVVVGIADFCSDYVNQALREMGVAYMFRKPCLPHVVAARLEHLMNFVANPDHADDQTKAARILIAFRFPPKIDGFRFLKVGLPLFAQDPQQRVCKELYVSIARICGAGSWNQVERSIRSAIEVAWNSGDPIWQEYFPGPKAPTGKVFISRIAQMLQDS